MLQKLTKQRYRKSNSQDNISNMVILANKINGNQQFEMTAGRRDGIFVFAAHSLNCHKSNTVENT